jgi:hypothetical protein
MSLTKVTYSMIDGPIYSAKDFGAVNDAAWTLINAASGGTVTGGTDSTAAIQSAIDAAYATGGGIVLIDGAYRINSTLTVKNNVTLRSSSANIPDAIASGSGSSLPAGLYTSNNITLILLEGTGLLDNLLLCGSGNLNNGSVTPGTVGTGVEFASGSGGKAIANLTLYNLKRGLYIGNIVFVVYDFINIKARFCFNMVETAASTTAFNVVNFFGGGALICDNVLYNPGSITGEQVGINFYGFHFEWLVRAVKGEFDNVNFSGCWFERISTTGLDQSRSNNDNVPLEPLAGSFWWGGNGNTATSTANNNLSVAGTSINVESYFTGTGDIRIINYGLSGSTITDNSNNTVFFAQSKNQVFTNMWLKNPRINFSNLEIDGDLSVGVDDFRITSAINTPRMLSVNAIAAGLELGTIITFYNKSGASVVFVDSSGAVSAGNRFELPSGDFTLATLKTARFLYSGSRWNLMTTTP